jgi:hypothetical protein
LRQLGAFLDAKTIVHFVLRGIAVELKPPKP